MLDFSTTDQQAKFIGVFSIDLFSGLVPPQSASLSSVTRALPSPRSSGQVKRLFHLFQDFFCQKLVDDCGDSGEAGKRDDDEGHLLAEQGEESLLQRSLPQVEPR